MRCLGAALVAGVAWICLVGGLAEADGLSSRGFRAEARGSLRFTPPNRHSEMSRDGWTVASEHFVVLATTSRDDAAWVAGELERTWTEIGRLADQWTQVHRQPGFGQGAVSIVVANRPLHPEVRPSMAPALDNPQADIFVNLSDGNAPLPDRLPQMRSEVFASFLRVAGHELLIPEWVQVGLAAYFSGEAAPRTSANTLPVPRPFIPPTRGAWAREVMLDAGSMSLETPRQAEQAVLWVRYLLEGDDAQHADQFFTALATAVAAGTHDELSSTQKARGVVPRKADPPPEHPLNLDRLTSGRIAPNDVADWLADPNVGQPIVVSADAASLDERQREMLLILKLARRFSRAPLTSIEPKIAGLQEASADDPAASPAPMSVAALYRRLTDPQQPRWATIDTDGRLLLSSDKERLAELFARSDQTYRTYQKNGHLVLEASLATGEVEEAWLEENPANPKRPLAYLRRKPVEPPSSQPAPSEPSPPAEQAAGESGTVLQFVR